MPLSRSIALFNRKVTNRITRRFAGWLPGFAILTHVGRKSGKTYETPINVFRRGDIYIVALTYGPESEWVKNVIEAGHCQLQTMGRKVELIMPRLFHDPERRSVPAVVRAILKLLKVEQFLELRKISPVTSGHSTTMPADADPAAPNRKDEAQ